MAILNYTTKVDSYKTIMEIQKALSKSGAFKITIDNDSQGNPIGLTFCIRYKDSALAFALPCNYLGVLKAMERNKKVTRSLCTSEQALRVSWRIIKDWVAAQMAIVEAELCSMAEVFLPYAITKSGDTVYKQFTAHSGMLQLENN